MPDRLPEHLKPTKKGGSSELPETLKETDFFGQVKTPQTQFYDPYQSAQYVEGRDVSAEQLAIGGVLEDISERKIVKLGSMPTVHITFGRTVAVLLMRDGKIVKPPAGSSIVPPPTSMAQIMTLPNSPYIYFMAKQDASYPDNYSATNCFVPIELDGHPVSFQIRLEIVEPRNVNVRPLVILDLVGRELPKYYEGERRSYRGNKLADINSFSHSFTHSGPTHLSESLGRAELKEYFPVMREMARLYSEAVEDGILEYLDPNNIIRFRVSSVLRGSIVEDRIPAFRNPYDNQLYHVVHGYYFASYDAILYEVHLHNKSSSDIWFNYGDLKIGYGLRPLENAHAVRVVSPEFGEVTKPGRKNRFWILIQGLSIRPETPITLLFPPDGHHKSKPRLSYDREIINRENVLMRGRWN